MTIHAYGHSRTYEMEALLKLFLPAEQFSFAVGDSELPPQAVDCISAVLTPLPDAMQRLCCETVWHGTHHRAERILPAAVQGNDLDREISGLFYPQLCESFGIEPPWGMLTGIRPVNLLRRFVQREGSLQAATQTFRDVWHVSAEKTALAAQILQIQQPIFAGIPAGKAVSVYVSIPFCPTRCRYCSFVSNSVTQMKQKLLPQYLEKLHDEIMLVGTLIREQQLVLDTLYIGGGTPTVLEAEALWQLLEWLEDFILLDTPDARQMRQKRPLREYTVEAGRPDTITREKLAVLQHFGVTRISVNPQSFCDRVLEAAGRPHSAQDAIDAYRLAKEMGFQNVNMDFIAGLPCDTVADFRASIEQAIALQPESITVHCLALKKAADFYSALPMPDAAAVCQMVDFAQAALQAAGYRPYYLYRQKNMAANLENVGYARAGFESPYNVLMMDDSQSILGIGAGASTKLLGGGRGIERITECKYPYEYLQRYDALMEKKRQLRVP